MMEVTNWDQYYKKKAGIADITRSFTRKKLINCLQPHIMKHRVSICEYGGANSCIAESFCDTFNVSNYHVVDLNEYGLSLLENIKVSTTISSELGDVLNPSDNNIEKFDLVFSIGLIEHFDQVGTQQAIDTHFHSCKPGGFVLITFPTPTILYKIIRNCAEAIRVWNFPDERPLQFREVLDRVLVHGNVLHQSINWSIGLTQGVVLAQKPF